MRYKIKSGIVTKTNGKVRGSLDLGDAVADILGQLSVPYEDPCCADATALQPVGLNPVTGRLQTSDGTTTSDVSSTVQTLTGAGAVSLTTYATLLVTTGANALTLAAGANGQKKLIKMKTDGGDGTLTPNSLQGGTTLTFNDANDFVELVYLDGKWNILTNSGATLA